MASAETRDVVKRYEVLHNPLLLALRPGGVLASVTVKGPCEALLVPRQVSLDAIDIIPYLQAKLQRNTSLTSPHSPPPPLSDLFGEGHDTPKRDQRDAASSSGTAASAREDATPSPSGIYYTAENEKAFRAALVSFLEYHLLHFDGSGNSEFTTLRGQRGAFSEDLDHVKRFGHIGQVAVLADADPLLPQGVTSSGAASRHGSPTPSAHPTQQGREKGCRPASLQIFIIDQPLMDSAEVRSVIEALRKLTVRDATTADVAARLNALFSNPAPAPIQPKPQPKPQQSQQTSSASNDLSFLLRELGKSSKHSETGHAGHTNAPSTAPTASPSPARRASHNGHLLDTAGSDSESIAETIIIDDFEEDVTEEPDLAPYVNKYTQISEQQRRRRSATSGISDDAAAVSSSVTARAVAAAFASAEAGVNAEAASAPAQDTPPLPGTIDPNHGRASGGVAQVTAHVVGAPAPSSTSSSVVASRAQSTDNTNNNNNPNTNSTSSRGRVVSVTLASPSNATGKSGGAAPTPTAVAATHANVLRHEYSRECIKDYRRVVAADNEIFYHVFEHLMALRCSAQLAKLMSSYVSKNQQLQQPIVNNVKYNKFVSACHELIRQVPRFAEDQKQLNILYEGIERYVTSRLYHQLFNVCEDEKRQNAMLQTKFERLENMTAEQLDALPEVERHHVWGQAMFELDGMDFFKSPREKLRCGMRSCELLSLALGDILRQRRNAKNLASGRSAATAAGPSGGSVPLAFGADEFLPCFLLLVLRARPLNYVQNICYIEKFRYASLLSPEESYCFATLQSAMMFWLNCKDDGRMQASPSPAAQATPGAQGGAAGARGRGSASVGALLSTGSRNTAGTAVAAAPVMTERDLLPSVRQASCTARAQSEKTNTNNNNNNGANNNNSNNNNGATAMPGATVVAQDESPTVLDVLFGWANRSFQPLVGEINGLSNGSRKATESASAFALNEAASPVPAPSGGGNTDSGGAGGAKTANASGTGASGGVALSATSRLFGSLSGTTGQPAKATASTSHFHGGHDVRVAATPPAPPQVHQPDANTRALARELLVTQHKSFEQLTLTEIQMIVEEARALLTEKK